MGWSRQKKDVTLGGKGPVPRVGALESRPQGRIIVGWLSLVDAFGSARRRGPRALLRFKLFEAPTRFDRDQKRKLG